MSKICKNVRTSKSKRHIPYTINNDTICFEVGFNGPLDKYYPIINTCKCLIFNNADNLEDYYDVVPFNTKFEIPIGITNVELNDHFNHPIELTPNLTHITFGTKFVCHVIFSRKIKYIVFKKTVCYFIILPKTVEHLDLRGDDAEYFELNKNLITLCVYLGNSLPNSWKHFTQTFVLNKAMRKLFISIYGSLPIILSKNLIGLTLEFAKPNPNIYLDLPKNIKKIMLIGFIFSKPLILTPCLTHFLFDVGYCSTYWSKTFIIEKPISNVSFVSDYYTIIENLPNGTKHMGLCRFTTDKSMENLPSDMQTVYVEKPDECINNSKVPNSIIRQIDLHFFNTFTS